MQFPPLILLRDSQVGDLYQVYLVEETSKPERVDRVLPRVVLEEVHGGKDQGVLVFQFSQWKVLKVDNLVSPQLAL